MIVPQVLKTNLATETTDLCKNVRKKVEKNQLPSILSSFCAAPNSQYLLLNLSFHQSPLDQKVTVIYIILKWVDTN